MTKQPDLTEKQKVEKAVQRLGQAITGLVGVFEQTAGDLSTEQADKAFAFAARILEQGKAKAKLSIETAIAANGGFDLDKEYEPKVTVTWMTDKAHLPSSAGFPDEKPVRVFDPERARSKKITDDDDVGFVDD